MKKPRPRGTDIHNLQRVQAWAGPFAGYRHAVTEERIWSWLNQFSPKDRDLAARVLDCVDFITYEQIESSYRTILNSLQGWHRDEHRRQGKWRFVPFTASSGESGDSMIHVFRSANDLSGNNYNNLFIYKSDVAYEEFSGDDTIVFVDDFAGSGSQACKTWVSASQELVKGNPKIVLALSGVSLSARQRIEQETNLRVRSRFLFGDDDNIFSPKCKHFTRAEKETLLRYCRNASSRYPRGFEDCGLVVVFAHKCPNNSIPILHASNSSWQGLFRR